MLNILLIVTGASPQVLTETVFALYQTGKTLPDKIFVITTEESKKTLTQGLFDQGHWQQLINDYQLPAIEFTDDHIWLIEDEQGNPIHDAKTEQEQTFMADFITRKVFELTNQEHTRIHASIAGGRKTMAFYLGYAMSLLGREQDTLSHVFVSDEFEFVKDFYYPTPYQKIIEGKHGQSVDCQHANITLAEIPFVRMRNSVDKSLINAMQNASFSQTVASLNAAHTQDLPLIINQQAKELSYSGIAIKLSAKEFAFYLWLQAHTESKERGLIVDRYFEEKTDYVVEFLNIFKKYGSDARVYNKYGIEPEDFATGDCLKLQSMERDFVQQTRSQINKKITNKLSRELADKITLDSEKIDDTHCYFANAIRNQLTIKYINE